jgi:hypothetical protein
LGDRRAFCGLLLFSQCFFPRFEFGLPLSELLLALGLSFRSQTFLHLSLNFSFPFFLGLLLLAGAKYRQKDNYRQAKKFFHPGIRPPFGFIIRTKQTPAKGPSRRRRRW